MTTPSYDISGADSYIPAYYTMTASHGPHAGDTQFTVNADGSVWVSDWTALKWWQDQAKPEDQGFPMLTLLLAARGRIREVTAEERDAIARDAGPAARAAIAQATGETP